MTQNLLLLLHITSRNGFGFQKKVDLDEFLSAITQHGVARSLLYVSAVIMYI